MNVPGGRNRSRKRSAGPRRPHDGLPRPETCARTEQPVRPRILTPGDISRRRFLKGAALGAAGLCAGPHLLPSGAARSERFMSRVVRAHHPDATTGWTTVNQEPVDQMVHTAICSLTNHVDPAIAWKSLFPGITAASKVGIKINLACGDVPTHPEVVNAIIDGLLMMDLGGETLPEEHIIVWDFDNAFFCAQTGYTQNWGGAGVQYVGTDHPSIGFDYSRWYYIQHTDTITTQHHVSKIVTEHIDYLINAAVMKDHDDWAGVTLSMKNHYGSFDNIYDVHMHYDYYSSGIPGLSAILRDEIGDKQKLFLIDGTFCLYDGGPGYTPPYHTPPNWIYNSVLMSLDTVACDRIGTIKINEKRIAEGFGALDPDHVRSAAGDPYNLGVEDPAEIELIELDLGSQNVADDGLRPRGVALLAPYPNPMREDCTLRFRCQAATDAELVITDARGAVVRRVAEARYGAGVHRVRWDGRDSQGRRVASGSYFCRLRAAGGTQLQRFVRVR